jgi:TetR/AcrR family transcriptional regulator, transcriptional repressor for nem operon
MSRLPRGERTWADIMRAAGRLFSVHGYHHTSMADILEAVSLSKGAFYYHFKSKEDLGLAVLAQLRQDYEEALLGPVRAVAQPGARLKEMFYHLVRLNESGQWYNCLLLARLAQEMAQQDGPLSRQLAETMNWLIGFWQELITDAQAAGTVKAKFQPRQLAELIVACLFGAVTFRELEGGVIHLDQVVQQLQDMTAA